VYCPSIPLNSLSYLDRSLAKSFCWVQRKSEFAILQHWQDDWLSHTQDASCYQNNHNWYHHREEWEVDICIDVGSSQNRGDFIDSLLWSIKFVMLVQKKWRGQFSTRNHSQNNDIVWIGIKNKSLFPEWLNSGNTMSWSWTIRLAVSWPAAIKQCNSSSLKRDSVAPFWQTSAVDECFWCHSCQTGPWATMLKVVCSFLVPLAYKNLHWGC